MSRSMKHSGIEWIGEIPSDWEVSINKTILQNVSVRNHPDAEVLSLYRDWGVVPKNSRDDNHNVTSEKTEQYKFVEAGDLVINKMKAWQGSLAVSEYEGIVSPAYYVCKFKNEKMDKKYIHHLLRCCVYAQQFECLSTGMRIGQWDLSIDDFLTSPLLMPSLKEQKRISDEIDKKCSEVDTLIANQQRQIEKLKQYKQSVISEVMTKGLNPNVEMKNSEIEWIGEIPSHWSVSKVSNFYEIVLGKMLQPQPNDGDTLEQYLCAANVGGNKLNLNIVKEMWFSEKEKAIYKLKRGDLVVVEGGDVASSAIIDFEPDNLYFQNALHRARAIRGETAFLRYWLIFAKGSGYFDIVCNKATIAHFTKDKFKALPMIYVSISEQKEIIKYLNEKCRKIDSLIAIKQQKIEKLNQYKKSIIYEYVTGKKEA